MNSLPLDVSRLITSQLDDKTLFQLSSLIDLTVHNRDQGWWYLRVRYMLDSRGYSDKTLTFREGSWQRAYYILFPMVGAKRACWSVHNDHDNEIAASCLIDLGWEIRDTDLSKSCATGSINLVKRLLPHLDPDTTTAYSALPLVAAVDSRQKGIIEILLADTRLKLDRHNAARLRMPHLRTERISELLTARGW